MLCSLSNSGIKETGGISCLTSGGPWFEAPGNLKLIGKRLKAFKFFSQHCYTPAGSALIFYTEVNVWEYKEDNPLYGDYSTKDWQRYYVSYCVDERGKPKNGRSYRYSDYINGLGFVDKEDYEAWLKTLRGVEFKGNDPNQTVVFGYKERDHLVDKDEWDVLGFPMDARLCNGVNLCKVVYDDEAHVIDVYRFSNSGDLDGRGYRPFELARSGNGWYDR